MTDVELAWVTRVFSPRTDLATIQQTGVEIRMLVQSFLDARLKALPDVQPPPPPVVHGVESQESQDEYDKALLDLNDEELLAALGEEAEASTVANLKVKEDALCKVGFTAVWRLGHYFTTSSRFSINPLLPLCIALSVNTLVKASV